MTNWRGARLIAGAFTPLDQLESLQDRMRGQ